jgi:hypothetical protein
MTGDRLRQGGRHYIDQLRREFSRFQGELASGAASLRRKTSG